MHVRSLRIQAILFVTTLALLVAPIAFGHIRIYPTESAFGAREKYTMRVPNERQFPTVRVVGEFPAGLDVYDFEFKPGWKIDFKKDEKGKIIGATWTGRIEPYEFVEFGMLAINPKSGDSSMLWKFHQYYEDGFVEEFTAPPDAKMPLRPMPQVILKPADDPASAPKSPSPSASSAPAPGALTAAGVLVEQGKSRFAANGCRDCHGPNGEGTDMGPDLRATRRNAEQISAFLQKPSSDARLQGMPNIPADSPDLPALVAYVVSIKRPAQ
jgi:uncharacterized protein YcnI